jgi:hypothetical protein
MKTYRVYASVTATAEHSCNCECCQLARFIEVRAAWSQTLLAVDEANAERQAWDGLAETLANATPRGYLTDIADEHVTVDIIQVQP